MTAYGENATVLLLPLSWPAKAISLEVLASGYSARMRASILTAVEAKRIGVAEHPFVWNGCHVLLIDWRDAVGVCHLFISRHMQKDWTAAYRPLTPPHSEVKHWLHVLFDDADRVAPVVEPAVPPAPDVPTEPVERAAPSRFAPASRLLTPEIVGLVAKLNSTADCLAELIDALLATDPGGPQQSETARLNAQARLVEVVQWVKYGLRADS